VSALAESLLTAFTLSGLAAGSLVLLPRTPPHVRFAVAAAGLAVWLVPWGWLRIDLPSELVGAPLTATLVIAGDLASLPIGPWLDAGTLLGSALAAASLIGLVLFVGDCVALRHCVRRWRATSRPADGLRSLLPPELAQVPAEIRIVENSNVAAASGYLAPTIWIGDRYVGERRRLTVIHEMWHVRSRDPLWLASIAAVRRAYWWNPLVAYLARQAMLMIESTCDHRSAEHFDKSRYITELAALLLADATPAPRLMATVHAASLNVQRLRLLGARLRLRARDVVLLAALGASAAATAMTSIVEYETMAALAEQPSTALPATPAGAALAILVRAANVRDSEVLNALLGAYTPQELPLPLPRGAGELRLVEVLRSEPLRIEYIVESRATGLRHVGELEVGDSTGTTIKASRLQSLP